MDNETSITMCASCWRIQPRTQALEDDLQEWMDPTVFMARGQRPSSHYAIIDGYCDPCLIEIALRDQLALARAEGERLNA
jgi:hypothetical protein